MPDVTWQNAYDFINPRIDSSGFHVWSFDPSFPLEVQFWYYNWPRQIRMNRHDYLELIFVDHGNVSFQIQDRLFDIHEGDLIVVGSTVFHRLIYTGTPTRAPRIMFLPQLIAPPDSSNEDAEYLTPFLIQDARFPHVVTPETGVPREVRTFMERMYDELRNKSTVARLCAKTYLRMILALLVKHYAEYRGSRSIFDTRQQDLNRLRPVLEFVNRHYAERIGIQDAADMVSMSRRTFTRCFRRVTGHTFVDFLTSVRIEKARSLLATGEKTIAEVSQEVGFCTQSYFGMVFRRLAHTSVGEYCRRLNSSEDLPASIRK
jgi:AraC-like DNA-binding protein